MKFARNTLVCLFLLGLSASAVFGQGRGNIAGTVTDPAGAVIPDAKVTIVGEGTQLTREVATNGDGQYSVTALPIGLYTANVEREGFTKLVRSGLQVTADNTISADLQLTVGTVQQTTEVKGSVDLVQSQNSTISALFTGAQTVELPLVSRSYANLQFLSPGVLPVFPPGNVGALTGYTSRTFITSNINGSLINGHYLDGWNNRHSFNYVFLTVISPPIESIEETRIITSNFPSQYGEALGGVTTVSTKSGTNAFHGSAFEYLRNDKLNANTFFANRGGAKRPVVRRNEYGFTLGGPIFKNKTFFFADYQGIRVRQAVVATATIPTLAQQQQVQTGDFSAQSAVIFDPLNVVGGLRVPFAGNIIPAFRVDPAARRVMRLLPAPTQAGAANNLTFTGRGTQNVSQWDVRVDHNIGDKGDRLFFKWSVDLSNGTSPGLLPIGPNPDGIKTGAFLTSSGSGGTSTMRPWMVGVNYTKVFSPTFLNEFRVAALRSWGPNIVTDDDPFNVADQLGIPGINISDFNRGMPAMNIAGFAQLGNISTYPEFTHALSVPIENTSTITRGNHTIRFGGSYTRLRLNTHTTLAARGQYQFSGVFARQIGSTTGGLALADFTLGNARNILRSIQFGTIGQRSWQGALYFDDAWRATRRLTINYGLRYELLAPYHEVFNRWGNIDVNTAKYAVAGTQSESINGACGRSLICLDKNNTGPRVGLAYLLTGDGKTVLRSGFGMSFFVLQDTGRTLNLNHPASIIQQLAFDQGGVPGNRLSQGLPLPVVPNVSSPSVIAGVFESNPSNLAMSKGLQMNISLQRQLTDTLVLEVAGVRSITTGVLREVSANQPLPGPGAFDPRRPLFSIAPNLGDIDFRTGYGHTKYNALQVQLTKRYGGGLTGALSYTWGHLTNNTNRPQNSLCYNCEWGNDGGDRRHTLVINHVYQLPFGQGRKYLSKGMMSHVIGGWDLSGVWTMYAGSHFSPGVATSNTNVQTGGVITSTAERPNLLRNPTLPVGERNITRWFDTTAFAQPANFTFGNAGRGILEGPGYFGLDAGIYRNFQIRENIRLTFRAEAYNATNRANFANPNATLGSPAIGTIGGTVGQARTMQLGLRLQF